MAELFIRTERVVPKNENEVSKPVPFSPFYVRELESFLADQAKEGFELKQISANNYSFTYEKSMPKELTYRLLLGPTQLDASLQVTLERAGWKLVTSMNKNWFEKDVVFHIFVRKIRMLWMTGFGEAISTMRPLKLPGLTSTCRFFSRLPSSLWPPILCIVSPVSKNLLRITFF